MMKKISLSLLILMLQGVTTTSYAAGESFMLGQAEPTQIFINNRILARVNGKAISAVDVMKQMDLMFYKQYPQYASIIQARHQFYTMHWQRVLKDLIDKQLILADAEEHKIDISHGDVRQEMEKLFGPNIILSLDKVGLTVDEARRMLQDDMIIKRTSYFRANSVAFRKVTPQNVRTAYEEYALENVRPEEWQYIVVSIRDQDPTLAAEVGNQAHRLLTEQNVSLEELSTKIAENSSIPESVKVTVSAPFRHGPLELSPDYKDALSSLQAGQYSSPIAQQSKRSKETVVRIFYLQNHSLSEAPSFAEVEVQLRNKLLGQAVESEMANYLSGLRDHYHVQHIEDIPEDFELFVLR